MAEKHLTDGTTALAAQPRVIKIEAAEKPQNTQLRISSSIRVSPFWSGCSKPSGRSVIAGCSGARTSFPSTKNIQTLQSESNAGLPQAKRPR